VRSVVNDLIVNPKTDMLRVMAAAEAVRLKIKCLVSISGIRNNSGSYILLCLLSELCEMVVLLHLSLSASGQRRHRNVVDFSARIAKRKSSVLVGTWPTNTELTNEWIGIDTLVQCLIQIIDNIVNVLNTD